MICILSNVFSLGADIFSRECFGLGAMHNLTAGIKIVQKNKGEINIPIQSLKWLYTFVHKYWDIEWPDKK